MKYFYYIFFLFINIFYLTVAHASPSTELSALLSTVKTMQADFNQTVYDNLNKPVQHSFGKMAMERPDKFRWEVTKPIPQLIIANQSRLWVYDSDLDQVTIRSLQTAVGEAPSMLLSYTNLTFDKDYTVTTLPNTNLQWFNLAPKSSDNMFATVQLGFSKGIINQMKLKDHLGNTTLVEFKNIKINPALATKIFVFKPPAGVDIIDETKKR